MKKAILAAAIATALGATLGLAQAPTASGQQGMMGNMPMLNIMNMMGMMSMMGGGPAGMATIDRIEGRIAFLRTELKITDAQTNAWNSFADALRTNAKKLGEVRTSMMSHMGAAQQQPPALTERLNLQEQWLIARLEETRAMKSVFTNLYAVLTEDQRKTANELLGLHMGLGMMEMMAGQLPLGQMPGMMLGAPGGRR
jgi:hypothetical protein